MTIITTTQTHIIVDGPYNTDFISSARKYGGKWKNNAWQFDVFIEKQVRQLCLEVYGTDGLVNDLCTVEVDISEDHYACKEPITLNGRVIAKATGRDSGATIAEGITVLSGGFKSGGSSKNWLTKVTVGGAKVLIRNFPRAAAKNFTWDDFTIKIIEEKAVDKDYLNAEKERLLARLAEIEEQIAQ